MSQCDWSSHLFVTGTIFLFLELASNIAMTTLSRKDLQELLKSYKEALRFWVLSLAQKEKISQIKAAEVQEPLEELQKVTKLIKAHTTKVGIIFKPDVLEKETESSHNTLQKLSESVVMLVSLVAQLNPSETSQIFFDEILQCINEIVMSNINLVDQLMVLERRTDPYREEDQETANEAVLEATDGRLVSVGKVWSSCDSLLKVLKDGKLGILNLKFKQSIALVEDGLDEFAEWIEDPDGFDDDDPFGFSDSDHEDEDEDEDDDDNAHPPNTDNNADTIEDNEKNKKDLQEFSKRWLDKFKLVKLLLTSMSKSLPSVTSGETINKIYQAQKEIVTLIDKLVVELMMNGLSSLCEKYGDGITKNCNKLLKVVKEVNKSNETKIKWCDTWSSKFGNM